MRKAVMPFVLSMGLVVGWAAPADAASTRAEYIAQVDPICQSFVGPLGEAWSAYHRNFKRTIRAARADNTKAFLRGTKKVAQSLNLISRTRTGMVDQIAAVPPPDTDAGTIGTWLSDLRQEGALESSAASAVLSLRINKFFRRLRQADDAETVARGAISGFGFTVCGNFPVV